MGLRETKKARLRAKILERSVELFREQGYEATPVREIASRLQISEGTFFNYFATKDSLLGDWVNRFLNGALEDAVQMSRSRSPRRTLRDLVRIVAPRIAEERDFARVAFQRAPSCPPAGPPRPQAAVQLFRDGQRRGEIRSDLPPEQLAELLAGALRTTLCSWLCREDDDPSLLAPRLLAALDLLIDGCRKRNERIRPARPPTAGTSPNPSAQRGRKRPPAPPYD